MGLLSLTSEPEKQRALTRRSILFLRAFQYREWKLQLQASARNFGFKLEALKVLPTCNLFRFSLKIKGHALAIKVKSEPRTVDSWKDRFLRSKFIRLFQIRRARRNGLTCKRRSRSSETMRLLEVYVSEISAFVTSLTSFLENYVGRRAFCFFLAGIFASFIYSTSTLLEKYVDQFETCISRIHPDCCK